MNEIVMPKLSDTMTEGRLVSWKKRVGETVRRGDVLAEVETDKANMELEAFVSGELLEIRVQSGEMAQVGAVIGVIGKAGEKGAQAAQPAAAGEPKAEPAAAQPQEEAPAAAKPETEEAPAAGQEPETAQAPAAGPKPETAQAPAAEPKPETAQAPAVERKPESAQPAAVAPTGEPAAAQGEEQPAVAEVKQGGAQAPAAPVAQGTGEAQAAAEPPSQPAGEVEAPVAPSAPGEAEAGGAEGQGAAASRERAAPVVRRRARELGVDLGSVKGTGPDGRILLQDLERHEAAPAEPGQPSAPVAEPAAQEGSKPLSRLRAAIAKTVSESWRSIPHFEVGMDLLMDEAEAVRRQLKQSGAAVTLTDLVVKGAALALQKFPQLNASFAADGVQLHGEINIGLAVAVPDGVLVPVIYGCQELSLLEISEAARGLAERARSGSLKEQEMSGGTFSVSNLGMYGVSRFSAIIYPSQAAVLAVGAVADTAVVRDAAPACAKVMKVTLSADHRLVDGAYAAQFLVELKAVLENPIRLLV